METPRYNNKPFQSIRALARGLGISECQLRDVAAHADRYYHPNKPEPKSDGTFRQHYRVELVLKRIQEAINKFIFYKTSFPVYLTGGIRDLDHPRDYIADANAHAGGRLLITEDIKDFFPSVHGHLVHSMWQYLYHLPPDVADLLTKLTTYRDMLPQGAPTSTYIGNLILWDDEPQLVATLESLGIRYTRYVDNIALSGDRVYTRAELGKVTSLLYAMIYRHGLRPKRSKRSATTRHRTQLLHNLVINSGKPTLSRIAQAQIRSAVHKYLQEKATLLPDAREQRYCSLLGRIKMLGRFHPRLASELLRVLND